MGGRALDAAGIHDPTLRASYAACRNLHARHGRTYFLATLLLPPAKRPAVHALYGFARYADEIVDELSPTLTPAQRADRLEDWGRRFLAGQGDDPILAAVLDTVHRYGVPVDEVERFLASMRMDLTVSEYKTWEDLLDYMEGSAAAIGVQLLPILGVTGEHSVAEASARELGRAFQMTNFVRDVGEDLRRGRLYLPLEDLELFDVSRADLERQAGGSLPDPGTRRLLSHEIARTRELYRAARPGIDHLEPTSRDCVLVAWRLYSGILDEVERSGYRVFDARATVSRRRRLAVAAPGLARSLAARQGS